MFSVCFVREFVSNYCDYLLDMVDSGMWNARKVIQIREREREKGEQKKKKQHKLKYLRMKRVDSGEMSALQLDFVAFRHFYVCLCLCVCWNLCYCFLFWFVCVLWTVGAISNACCYLHGLIKTVLYTISFAKRKVSTECLFVSFTFSRCYRLSLSFSRCFSVLYASAVK